MEAAVALLPPLHECSSGNLGLRSLELTRHLFLLSHQYQHLGDMDWMISDNKNERGMTSMSGGCAETKQADTNDRRNTVAMGDKCSKALKRQWKVKERH